MREPHVEYEPDPMDRELPPEVLADPLIAPLNPEQRQAVLTTEGPVLVLAGAGSGKTRVITHRIAWIIGRMHVPGWQVLAMTFTNKAAGEMRERVAHTVGDGAAQVWLGTFHSIGVRLLRQMAGYAGLQPSFSIYDTDDQVRLIGRIMKAGNISDAQYKPKQFAGYIDRAKNRLLSPGDPALREQASSAFDRRALDVYTSYEREMRLANAVDFGDLIMLPAQVLAREAEVCMELSRRFRYVLVDEFQDTNYAQFELLKFLTSYHGNLCVVGDDDQSIYSWRGAEVSNILGFAEKCGGTTVKLERNYRSTETILRASTAVVSRNKDRHGKVLWTDAGMGEPITLHVAASDRDEADWVARRIDRLRDRTPLSQFAVFYRTNACSRVLEESMRRFRLPYVLIGGMKFYERAEVKDALAWCRLLVNADDSAAWARAVQSPKRGIGDTTLELVQSHAGLRGLSLPAAAEDLVRSGGGGRAAEKLREFIRMIGELRDGLHDLRADQAGMRIVEASGLKKVLQQDKDPDAQDRLENLQQLITAMGEHADSADDPGLRSFLENVALVADTDRLGEGRDRVSMMTLHSAKGLEFDVAFVIGVEEGLLPHANVLAGPGDGGEPRDLEEERRLFYVGMTRARKKLHLTYARLRRRFDGREMPSDPSRFLETVPRDLVQVEDSGSGWKQTPQWGQAWQSGGGQPARPAASSFGGTAGAAGAWGQRPNQAAVARPGSGPSVSAGFSRVAGGLPAAGAWGARPTGAATAHSSAAAPEDDLPTYDRSDPDGGFRVGGRASHTRFGIGQVLDIAGYGADAQLTVQFAQVGVKKIVARFLRPA